MLREHGTERAFTGAYEANKATGVYMCAGCGAPLFASATKYNSGSGWPSYTAPLEPDAVEELRDASLGMVEPKCAVPAATGIWAMSFPMGRGRTGCAIASTAPALISSHRIDRARARKAINPAE